MIVSEQEKQKRLSICNKCPFKTGKVMGVKVSPLARCKKCGCFLELKTKLDFSECPMKKW